VIELDELEQLLADAPGVTVINGALHGDGFWIEVEEPESARTLMKQGGAALLYREETRWSGVMREEMINAVEEPMRVLALIDEHVLAEGQLVSVGVDVVLGGVLHRMVAMDRGFRAILQAYDGQMKRQDACWRREQAVERRAYQERLDRVRVTARRVRENLPAQLLADELWSTAANRRARELRARVIVYRDHPDLEGEQKIATAILDAVETAQASR
jgi:hypothetical protein